KQVARSGAIQVSKSFANRQARSCRRTSPQTASSIHRPLVVPIPDRFLRDAPLGFVHTWGEVAEHPRGTSRSQLRPPPTPVRHTAAPSAGATASNPSLASCSRKQYVAGGSAFTAVHRVLQGGKPPRSCRDAVTSRASSGKNFSGARTFLSRAPMI